jgi:hypothetical protein
MDRVPRIRELYSELDENNAALKPFITPQRAEDQKEWSQEKADEHLLLLRRRTEIIAELANLEGGNS